jgi:hypothetical protein
MSGYIGTQPVPQATQTRDAFTCTAGQTSFATSGYTPDYLDVYLNGIKLAAADYTASNGSDVVLASGAALNDILEVVAYSSFEAAHVTGADDFTVTGSFTSQGIDDNATSTAMTLDASGNLLVGKTSAAFNTAGTYLQPSGLVAATASSSFPMALNRLSTDGDILSFFKDTSPVGSIGATGGYLTVTASGGSDAGAKLGNSAIFPCNTDGSDRDAGINLGLSTVRWKDLYLSGGVYLGGTGSANKLDDYEEGTWTPSFETITGATYSLQSGFYTKIGDVVTFHMALVWTAGTSIGGRLDGLPFAVRNSYGMYPMCSAWNNAGVSYAGKTTLIAYPSVSTTKINLDLIGSGVNPAAAAFSSAGEIYVTGHYYTDA